MNENPYASPEPADSNVPQEPAVAVRNPVLEMVRAQRGMMWLLLAKFAADLMMNVISTELSGTTRLAVLSVCGVVVLAVAFFVFRLANAIYGIGPGILCAMLSASPCIGFFTIMILNGTAIDRLRKSGVRVGFMGATKDQLYELETRQPNA